MQGIMHLPSSRALCKLDLYCIILMHNIKIILMHNIKRLNKAYTYVYMCVYPG